MKARPGPCVVNVLASRLVHYDPYDKLSHPSITNDSQIWCVKLHAGDLNMWSTEMETLLIPVYDWCAVNVGPRGELWNRHILQFVFARARDAARFKISWHGRTICEE